MSVTAPLQPGEQNWKEVSTKQGLERECLEEVHWHFTQAVTTPFLQQPLLGLLGLTSVNTTAFNQILEGTFQCPPECDKYTKNLFPT